MADVQKLLDSPTTVFVSNIAGEVTEDNLKAMFNFCGTVKKLQLGTDAVARCKTAIIEFESEEGAEASLPLNGTPLLGKALQVLQAKAAEEAMKLRRRRRQLQG
mmetsp:Transcript_35416/g.92181  ORF Transcript_35416/g.92181 Transcript_35416/m.92181 type:complete len:104 (-) Transcript_35416:1439-1750(-)